MEANDKKAQILEAAIRRFAHFGVQKTTLTEIADDLGITKQALAYYFADKHSLADAVEEQVINEFFGLVETHFETAASIDQALTELVEVKRAFFDKYAMLMQSAAAEVANMHGRIADSRQKVRTRMVGLIANRLERDQASGGLKQMDAQAVAAILFDTMSAYEHCAVGRQMVPDPKTFADLCDRQQAAMQLMVNGLKAAAWKH